MSNCAKYIKDLDVIEQFFIDAYKVEVNDETVLIIGGDGSKCSMRLALYAFKWTDDIASPVFDEQGIQIGYDKKVSDLTETADSTSIKQISRSELRLAIKNVEWLQSKTQDQIDIYIEDNVIDLSSAKQFLKMLSKFVKAQNAIINFRK